MNVRYLVLSENSIKTIRSFIVVVIWHGYVTKFEIMRQMGGRVR